MRDGHQLSSATISVRIKPSDDAGGTAQPNAAKETGVTVRKVLLEQVGLLRFLRIDTITHKEQNTSLRR
jgi:hypothetical protein